ncbi:hypothetical protein CANINC_001217 [Pichia inconspicua]|uniref:Chloride channel protein n=1 Tax=Pichia inconspicua TaxID=52247 RepID=A0A4V4NG13_9ASCO|nr:hypothetical protein CANINC_001217 [[Candida] inconspicua]
MDWQTKYNNDAQVQRLARNFDKYVTIDWREERIANYVKEIDEIPLSQDSFESLIQSLSTGEILKTRLFSIIKNWFVLTSVAIVIGTVAALVSIITSLLDNFKEISVNYGLIVFTLVSILFGLIASTLCVIFAIDAAGSGISEVKAIIAGFNRNSFLSWRVLIIKALALPFTIASGLSVGKEGPSVHYAACIGSSIPKIIVPSLKNSPNLISEIISAASGAGVAVAFGSPIGGVLFTVEEMGGIKLSTLWKTFYTSLIAITILQWWNPFGTGQIVMFEVRYTVDWEWFEAFWFVLLGICGGIYGILVIKWNILHVYVREKFFSNRGFKFACVIEVGILCTITALLSYYNQFMRQDMAKVMGELFVACDYDTDDSNLCNDSNTLILSLAYATILRIALVAISYGCKVPCGIFVPSMAVGATFGKLIGVLLHKFGSPVNSGIYAFLGAGATLSGVTGLTATVVVIMYELTGAIKYIVPTMITVVSVRVIVAIYGNGNGGIAEQMLIFAGTPFLEVGEGCDGIVLDLMVKNVIGIDIDKEIDVEEIKSCQKKEYPVWKDHTMIGVVKHDNIDLNQMDKEFITIETGASIFTLGEIFATIGPRIVWVLQEGSLVGIVTRKDFIRYLRYMEWLEKGDVFVSEYAQQVYVSRILALYKRLI